MSDAKSRLPARPSLEQLRKRARERLRALRVDEPSARLADAQHALAREYGFASWPKLVHHVEDVVSAARLDRFERLAADILAAYGGDGDALDRLITHFGVSHGPERFRETVRDRVDAARGVAAAEEAARGEAVRDAAFVDDTEPRGAGATARSPSEPTLDDVRDMVASQYGFGSWSALAESLAQPADPAGASRAGTAAPPFYRIDETTRTIEPIPPLSRRDWDAVLGVMEERRLTGIRTPAMTNRAMERLSRLDFVTSIDAGGARRLTDRGVAHLAGMPQLESLDLGGRHSRITDRGLEALGGLGALERFKMCWAQRVSDRGMAHLRHCDRLESVDLMGSRTGDGVLEALRGKAELRRLKTGVLLTDRGLPALRDLPRFARWSGGEERYSLMSADAGPTHLLLDGPVTQAGLAALDGLEGLFGLSFFWHASALEGRHLAPLAGLPNLGFLGCEGELCDDDAMRHIGGFPKLRMLMGQGSVASDEGFAALAGSRTLEHFWGRACPNLTGRGFVALAEMPALEGLAVSLKNVGDEALATLPRFPSLRGLMPMDVTDDGFVHVGRCERLEELWCMYCRDTGDAATGHIQGLSRLRTYYAGKTRISDASLEILARMSSLESIELWETAAITDAGVAALARLPRLERISISGAPRVTRAGMGVFAPDVEVDYGG